MSLFKNRKRSGMVLTGVVLSSGVVSAVNQGVAGAVPQNAAVGSANTVLNNSNVSTVLKGIGVILFFAVAYFLCAMVKKCFMDIKNENKVENNENNKVDGEFETVFCSDKKLKDKIPEETLEKMVNLEGRIFNTSIEEISKICDYSSAKCNHQPFFKQHKNERVNVLICDTFKSGWLKLDLLDKQGKTLVRDIYTKYAVNCEKLDSFCNNLSKEWRAYHKGMPFGKVFYHKRAMRKYSEDVKTKWEELAKFEKRVYNVSVKEIRAICVQSDANKLEKILRAYGVNKKEISIRINKVCNGYLGLDVLGKENEILGCIKTKDATTDADELGNLVDYLDKSAVFGETPFSKVFCSGAFWNRYDTENISNWKELRKFKGKTLNIGIKDLRLIVDSVENLDEETSNCKLKGKKIKVEISPICKLKGKKIKVEISSVTPEGYLQLSVFGENNGDKQLFSLCTNYAVKDNAAIGRLVEYLEEKTKEESVGNMVENSMAN